jgi:hypothetical protein
MTDYAEIAKSLTEEQRKTLCKPRKGAWPEREQAGFPSEMFGPRWCGFAHLSSLGLAVRAYLGDTK